jgi:phospholipid/cholesterol/gamma-HCH transport system substrate-binding protein
MTVQLSRTRAEARRLRVVGVVWLLLLALLVLLSVATYNKAFDGHVTVAVQTPRTGMQLNVGGDVRMNGAIVGRVSAIEATDDGARVEVQLDGDDAEEIPVTTTARILPTTLFGQKYVELSSSADPGEGHVEDGDVLRSARGDDPAELTRVLDRLEMVLSSVQPQRLSAVLQAAAYGLDGQGTALGELIEAGGSYLSRLNALAPLLVQDLVLLEAVTRQYARDLPLLLAVVDDATTTAGTLTEGTRWQTFLSEVTRAATAGEQLLTANRRQLREAAALSRPTLELLAEYAPQLPCTITGFLGVRDSSAAQIKGASVEGYFTFGEQVDGYTSADELVLGDLGTGPSCRGLPDPPIPYPAVDLDDGVEEPDR